MRFFTKAAVPSGELSSIISISKGTGNETMAFNKKFDILFFVVGGYDDNIQHETEISAKIHFSFDWQGLV